MTFYTFTNGDLADADQVNANFEFNKDSTEINTSLLCLLDELNEINLSEYENILKGSELSGSTTIKSGTYNWSSYLTNFATMKYYDKNMGSDNDGTKIVIGYIDTDGHLRAGFFDLTTKTFTQTHLINSADFPATTGLSGTYTTYTQLAWEMNINAADELVLTIWVRGQSSTYLQVGLYACSVAYNDDNSTKTASTTLIDSESVSSSYDVTGVNYANYSLASGNNVNSYVYWLTERYTISNGNVLIKTHRVWRTYNGTTFSFTKTAYSTSDSSHMHDQSINDSFLLNGVVYHHHSLILRPGTSSGHNTYRHYYKSAVMTAGDFTSIENNQSTYSDYARTYSVRYLDYIAFSWYHSASSSTRYPYLRFYRAEDLHFTNNTTGNTGSPNVTMNCMKQGVEVYLKGFNTNEYYCAHRHDTDELNTITKYSDIRLINGTAGSSDWYYYVDPVTSNNKYYYITNTTFGILDEIDSDLNFQHTLSDSLTGLNKLFSYSITYINPLFRSIYELDTKKFIINDGLSDIEKTIGVWDDYSGDVAAVKLKRECVKNIVYARTTNSYILLYK